MGKSEFRGEYTFEYTFDSGLVYATQIIGTYSESLHRMCYVLVDYEEQKFIGVYATREEAEIAAVDYFKVYERDRVLEECDE